MLFFLSYFQQRTLQNLNIFQKAWERIDQEGIEERKRAGTVTSWGSKHLPAKFLKEARITFFFVKNQNYFNLRVPMFRFTNETSFLV